MKGSNTCQALKIKSTEICGRRCIENFCFQHKQRKNIISPCKNCGLGTRSKHGYCTPCYISVGYMIIDLTNRFNEKLITKD